MLSKQHLEALLTRCMRSNADFAEIFEEEGSSEAITMLNNKVEDVSRALRGGIGIRLYEGTRSVYGYSNETDDISLEKMIDDLRASLGKKEEGKQVVLREESYENINPVRIDPIEAPLKDKVDLLLRAGTAAFEESAQVEKVSAALSSVKQKVQISNSNGKLVQDVRVRTRMSCSAYASDGQDLQTGTASPGASMGLEFYETTTPEQIGREAVRVALVLTQAKPCPSGRMPVIIDNGFGGVIFHEACGHSLEATAVAKNQSVFAGKLGEIGRAHV